MKLRRKFAVSNLIMLITPISLIGVISVVFLAVFVVKYPVEQLYVSRAALLDPHMLFLAIGIFFQNNPGASFYLLVWLLLCILTLIVTTTLTTYRLSRSIERPIGELRGAVDMIRAGNLDFEVMGSTCYELDNLCSGFDEMRRSLRLAAENAAQMNSERNLMLASLSHDLKTPITSIKGYVEGIRDGVADTPEKQRKYLDTIYAKASVLEELADSLSAYSKLELSRIPFEFETADINAFLSDITEDMRLDLEKNGMELKCDISEAPCYVRLDREQLGRVFSNIVNNAIKYRCSEHPCLRIASNEKDRGIYITVTDNGIGIEQHELKNVFESFYRVDSARSSAVSGSGLGLGIAKQIVEKHGGRIWLRSEGAGKGTEAVIYLPGV